MKTLRALRFLLCAVPCLSILNLQLDAAESPAAVWTSMNPGIPGVDREAKAIAVDSTGTVYVGGEFSVAGTVPAPFIAKWDGVSWSTLGTGMNGPVYALTLSGGDLYAAGAFTKAGGVPANRIARWNGSVWSPLGSGVNEVVDALAVSGSTLYVGGDFGLAGGKVSPYIASVTIGTTDPAAPDQDGDGVPDFAETYFGTSPAVPGGAPPVTVGYSATQVSMSWPEAAPAGVTVTPQWSPDLCNWLASGETVNNIPARTFSITSPSVGQKHAVLPTTGLPRVFFRLRLSRQ